MENYVVTSAGSVISQSEQAAQRGNMREAVRQGFKFMKIKLNVENYEGNPNQSEIKFNGVQTVLIIPAGRATNGAPKYTSIVRGGQMTFWWKEFDDPNKDGFYADMLDDTEPARYAETGYNRDFLATHIESGWFKIIDPKVVHDVKARFKKIAEIVANEKEEKVLDREKYLASLKEKQEMIAEEIRMAEESEDKGANNKTGS